METEKTPSRKDSRRNGRPMGGLVLILIGSLLLAREMGAFIPHWIFSWPMIPIAVGLFIGARHSFAAGGWMVPIAVGLFFLLNNEILDNDFRHLFWPVIIICLGFFMIVRPGFGRRRERLFGASPQVETDDTPGDLADSFSIFGGTKKTIISKNLRGGTVEAFFGGADLNLTQADFQGNVVIDFNVAFGGAKIVVPPQWNVRNEISAILGGVDEKRQIAAQIDSGKTLILRGTVMFGGIEIKSY